MLGYGINMSLIILIFLSIGLFLCFVYCVFIMTQMLFGSLPNYLKTFLELTRLDNTILLLLFIANILLGLNSSIFIKSVNWLI
jgi:NADH:ubiquinone oxidoreductase subunit 4 (subunit M)